MLTLDELRAAVEAGEIDTVVVAFTDMQDASDYERARMFERG